MSDAERSAAPLAIALFGPFEVRLEGRPLPRLRSQKGQWLLALLALQGGRAVERTWLAGTLWPDSTEHQAAFNLRRNLTDLRHALGAQAGRLVAPTPHTLRLDLVGARADVLVFDEAIALGDPPSLERAVALYRGPLLHGCEEEWVLQERVTREEAYLAALETLAGHTRARGDHAGAVHYLRQLIAVDPLRDSAQRGLMQALAAGGDVGAAAQVYRDFRFLLHRELNAAPTPETTALYEQLRAAARAKAVLGSGRWVLGERRTTVPTPSGKPTPLPSTQSWQATRDGTLVALRGAPSTEAIATSLPRPLTPLIGREREVRQVKERLAAARLVTLTGPGGIGKTRLAIQVAEECRNEVARVAFVDLAALGDPALVPQAVAAALGVREPPGGTPTAALQEFLAFEQSLLVLDNCEHLIPACAKLSEALLSEAPGLRLLATSRQPFGEAFEVIWPVPPLSLPDAPGAPSALLQSAAVRLFAERAAAVAPAFALTEGNAAAVAQICRRLDGIPLAIELAAARLRVLSVEQTAARLHDRFRLLVGTGRTAPPRHQTLRATMDWSYDLLSEPERALLRRLSVFAGGFTLDAADAVCGEVVPDARGPAGPRASGIDVLDLLTALVDKSLVAVEPRGAEARYRLLETTRKYAEERLVEAGEGELLRRRYLEWCLAIAQEPPSHREEPAWLQQLEAEHDNLRAALAWAIDNDAGAALRLAQPLCWFWLVRGYVTEGREWLRRILDSGVGQAGDPGDRVLRADVLQGAGLLAMRQGDDEAACALSELAVEIFRQVGEQRGIGACLSLLSQIRIRQGDFAAAALLSEEALTIHRALGRRGKEANDLDSLGQVASFLGDYAAARQRYGQSLEIHRELGDRLGEVYSLHNLGEVARREGDFASARARFEESLRLAREIDDRRGIANALHRLGQLAGDRGETALARSLLEESLTLFRGLNDRMSIGMALIGLGRIAAQEASYGEARTLLSEWASDALLQRARTRGWHRLTTAEALEAFADLAAREGSAARSARLRGAAEAIRESVGAPLPPGERSLDEAHLGALRAALCEQAFVAAWAEGRSLTLEQVIEYALQSDVEG